MKRKDLLWHVSAGPEHAGHGVVLGWVNSSGSKRIYVFQSFVGADLNLQPACFFGGVALRCI